MVFGMVVVFQTASGHCQSGNPKTPVTGHCQNGNPRRRTLPEVQSIARNVRTSGSFRLIVILAILVILVILVIPVILVILVIPVILVILVIHVIMVILVIRK